MTTAKPYVRASVSSRARPRRLIAQLIAALLWAVALASCGSGGGMRGKDGGVTEESQPETSEPSREVSTSEIEGSVLASVRPVRVGPDPSPPYGSDLDDFPRWHVTTDGWLLRTTGYDEATGLPELRARLIGDSGVDALRRLLSDAHLDAPPAPGSQPDPDRSGSAMEVATVNQEGIVAVHRIMKPTSTQRSVLDALEDPVGRLGEAVARSEARYRADAFRIVADSTGASTDSPKWPVTAIPLATAQECTVLRGDEAEALAAGLTATGAPRLRPVSDGVAAGTWSDRGSEYRVSVRVVLPGEPGCPPHAPSAAASQPSPDDSGDSGIPSPQ